MHRRGLLALCFGAAAAWSSAAAAQGLATAVVVLDQDALFARSLFGQRLRAEVEAASAALARENRRIEAELEAEEQALTDRRPTTDPAAFSDLAAAFDTRVEAIRAEQDAKARALQQQSDRARGRFQAQAGPILAALAAEVGASVVLDRRFVIASADQVDVTDRAVARIDAALGDGGGAAPSESGPPASTD